MSLHQYPLAITKGILRIENFDTPTTISEPSATERSPKSKAASIVQATVDQVSLTKKKYKHTQGVGNYY